MFQDGLAETSAYNHDIPVADVRPTVALPPSQRGLRAPQLTPLSMRVPAGAAVRPPTAAWMHSLTVAPAPCFFFP